MQRPAAVFDESTQPYDDDDEEMGDETRGKEVMATQPYSDDEEMGDELADEEETTSTMKKPVGVLKKPASVQAEADENEVADEEEAVVMKKPAGVLKKPASGQAEEDENEVAKRVVMKRPAGVLKKPASGQAEEDENEVVDEEEEADVQKKPAAKRARLIQDEKLVQKKPAGLLKKPATAEESELVDSEGTVTKKPDDEKSGVDVASRTKELKSMAASELKDLVLSKDLEASSKSANVEAILAWEAKEREAALKRLANAKQITANLKKDLAAKSAPELSDLCLQKGLKKGGSKDEKVERLFAHAKEVGVVARVIAASEREQRKEELSKMDKSSLYDLCTKKGIDPLNKEVMIDRIIAHDIGN